MCIFKKILADVFDSISNWKNNNKHKEIASMCSLSWGSYYCTES